MHEFRKAVEELDHVIYEAAKETGNLLTFVLAGVAMRSTGIADYLLPKSKEFTAEDKKELRKKIHKAFGAPGDFGYTTSIGQALQRLYRMEIK